MAIYVRKSSLNRLEGFDRLDRLNRLDFLPTLEGVAAFMPMKKCDCTAVAPAQWRDKDEELYMPVEHAAYLAKPDYKAARKDLTPSTAQRHDDPLSRHRLS